MAENILICRIDEPVYTKVYELRGELAKGHKVNVYAECRKNNDSSGKDDYYKLSFFFDADGYGTRDFVIGVSCGNHELTQQELDAEITSWLKGQIAEDVLGSVDLYLTKEHLFEKWSEEQAGY